MKLKILALIALFSISASSFADPVISSDTGKGIDRTHSEKESLDRKLEASKSRSRAHRNTDEDSRAVEASTNRADRRAWSRSKSNQSSASIDVNINSLIIQQFVNRYEKVDGNTIGNSSPLALQYFNACRPITTKDSAYPTLNGWLGGFGVQPRPDYNKVTGRNSATKYTHSMLDPLYGGDGDGSTNIAQGFEVDPTAPYISKYARCRIVAHFWISEAATRAVSSEVRSESEIKSRIADTFGEMESDDQLFYDMQAEAKSLWSQASCTNWLKIFGDLNGAEIDCGVFIYNSKGFQIDYRETLSANSIDGKTFKIAVSGTTDNTYAEEDSQGNDYRKSVASRTSDARERATEQKKQASLARGQTIENGMQTGRSRKDGAGLSATGGSK